MRILCVALCWSLTLAAAAAPAARLTRQPSIWLQTQNSVLVAWQTDVPTTGLVLYGTSPVPDQTATHPGSGVDHAVTIAGLAPGTRYLYHVAAGAETLVAGGGSFRTAPAAPEPFRFLAFGDLGRATSAQIEVAARVESLAADLAILTGDIIYERGEAANFTPQYFDIYRSTIRGIPFYSCLGNHDILTLNGQPYLDAFHLPANNASATERYYSFDYGEAHFVALDASRENTALPAAMLDWLAADLAATDARWKFVFFHIPIYSNPGRHGSDLVMRAQLAPIFEAHDVDIVFQGHNHYYTRTYPIAAGSAVDAAQDPSYTNPGGPIYIVTGGAGRVLYALAAPAPFEVYSSSVYHVTVVDVAGDSLALYAVAGDGTVFDAMSLRKPVTTAVWLEWFAASVAPEGILLRWRAGGTPRGTAFHLDRIGGASGTTRLTGAAIAGGPELEFLDRTAARGREYRYVLIAVGGDGREVQLGVVDAIWEAAPRFALGPPRPNPSAAEVEIPFTLDRAAPLYLDVIDAAGRRVRTLAPGVLGPGAGILRWDGRSDAGTRAAAGVYFVHLRAGERRARSRLVLSR